LAAFFVFVAARLPGSEYGGRSFTTTLSGANEVPGPGDEDGSGTATITLNPGQEEVCWQISVSGIALPATGAHIHEGAVGVAGPVDVTLSPPDGTGMSGGCTTVDRDEILEIIQHPDEYYVNVHNADFPAGAIRGQLGK
jgi:hypothetical protein